jgi:hypothetical protein
MSKAAREHHLHSAELELPLECSLLLGLRQLEQQLSLQQLSLLVQARLQRLPLIQETCHVNDE